MSPPVSSGKTESRRLEMEPGAVDGLDTLQDNTSSPQRSTELAGVAVLPVEPLRVSSAHPAESQSLDTVTLVWGLSGAGPLPEAAWR